MTKVVYSARYGGFGLSHEAVMRYAEIKGVKLYPEEARWSSLTGPHYWLVPPEDRPEMLEGDAWHRASQDERIERNRCWAEATFDADKVERTDPVLVQVVEELGDKASGRFAKLQIAEIPDGSRYRIDEYDGFESVETPDTYEWKTA